MKVIQLFVAVSTSVVVGVSSWWWFNQPQAGFFAEYLEKPQQTLSQIEEELARQLLQRITACTQRKVRELAQQGSALDLEKLEAASIICFMEVMVLTPDRQVAGNTEVRLTRLLNLLGVTVPQPIASGQADIPLGKVKEAEIFTLPVQIQGKSKTFLLDTGASASVIDEKIAAGLGLKGIPIPSQLLSYSVVGDNCDRVRATIVPLPTLQVGTATVSGLSGLTINGVPTGSAGVLGLDFLSNYTVYLQPQRSQLRLLPRTAPPNDPNLLPLIGRMGVMVAPTQVHNRPPELFLLDTGADVMVIGESFAQTLGIDFRTAPEIEVKGFCGIEKARKVKLSSVQVGTYQLTNLDAVVIRGEILQVLGVKGIIGQNYLNRFEQVWYFGDRNALGYPTTGHLSLTPILPVPLSTP
ncbi:MAG: retroviral-like aspartic protease family protein [Pseudanabaenaceae cyanobacterium]